MAPEVQNESRRSVRQRVYLPVLLGHQGTWYPAETGVISPTGALVLVSEDWPLEIELDIENSRTGLSSKCRVVWQGGQARAGLYKLGLEFLEPQPNFWGADYEPVQPSSCVTLPGS